jgi:hypothetical protein
MQLKDEDVAIVKMDATNNDVSGPYEVRGFPTLYWAPKNGKDSPIRYEVSVTCCGWIAGPEEVSMLLTYQVCMARWLAVLRFTQVYTVEC